MCMCKHSRTEPLWHQPQNVFHAYEKKSEMAQMERLREDLTLLKFSLLPISSFPPASAKETEKERPTGRQTEKEIKIVFIYSRDMEHLALDSPDNCRLFPTPPPGIWPTARVRQVQLFAARLGLAWSFGALWWAAHEKKKGCGVQSAEIARDSHDYPVANQSISWVSVCDACRFAVVAWGVISCLFYCSPKHGVKPHPNSGWCCGSITEHKGNVFITLLHCFADWFKSSYWRWIFFFFLFLTFGVLVMTL